MRTKKTNAGTVRIICKGFSCNEQHRSGNLIECRFDNSKELCRYNGADKRPGISIKSKKSSI